jgi:hypothetical protein
VGALILPSGGSGSSGVADSFSSVVPDYGTNPTASGSSPLAAGSSDLSSIITGSSASDALDFTKPDVDIDDHFFGGFYGSGIVGSTATFHAQGVGAGATYQNGAAASTAANPGILELVTGTDTGGVAWVDNQASGVKPIYIGGGKTLIRFILRPSAVSDGTNAFGLLFGVFEDTVTSTTSANGIYGSYSHGLNSGNLVCNHSKGGSHSTITSSVAVNAAGFLDFRAIHTPGVGTTFYSGSTSLGSLDTTNVPLSTTALRIFAVITKTAGTTSRSLYIDRIRVAMKLS